MKQLLVIAYYFPPMGLSGVQRITKFVKYLPEYGWAPTVLTTEPAGYFAFDHSLLEDLQHPDIQIVRTVSPDPTRIFGKKSTVSLPQESSRKRLSSISQFVFIPDNKIGWRWPAVQKGVQLHRKQTFDCILATAPPYTCALIAKAISKRCDIPYVLDFRDDWLENPRHEYATPLHKLMHAKMEAGVFNQAASITTINRQIAGAMQSRHPERATDIHIINQGFDPADLKDTEDTTSSGIFTLLYTGVFYDAQKPDYFLKALAAFLEEAPAARQHVRANFWGLLPEYGKALIEKLKLADVVSHEGYLPHDQVTRKLLDADVLWMTVGSGPGQETISTSKLFEYFGTRKPILGLVPAGAAREALESYGAGHLAQPEDVDEIKLRIRELYDLWVQQTLKPAKASTIRQFDRQILAGQLAKLLVQASR